MVEAEQNLSSAQKGKAVESLVALTLTLASDGRLSPYAPVSDDCGIDLLIFDKVTHRIVPLQIKSRIANPARQTVQFNVRKATLDDLPNRYLLGILFDPVNIAMTASWLIPMTQLTDVSTEKAEVFSVAPNISEESRDRCRPFRLGTTADLTKAILEVFDKAADDRRDWKCDLGG